MKFKIPESVIAILFVVAGGFVGPASTEAAAPLQSLQEIKAIPSTEVRGQAVDFVATVTYLDPYWRMLFVQADDVAIYVTARNEQSIEENDSVRVVGRLREGDLSPIIVAEEVTVLGKSKPPLPVEVDLGTLPVGKEDSRFVRTELTVAMVHVESQRTLLICRSSNPEVATVWVYVKTTDDVFHKGELLPGRKVRVLGTMGIRFVDDGGLAERSLGERQIVGFHLFCRTPTDVQCIDDETEDDETGDSETEDAGQSASVRVVELALLKSTEFADGSFLTHGKVSLVEHNGESSELVIFDDDTALRFRVLSSHGIQTGAIFQINGIKRRGENGEAVYEAKFLRQFNVKELEPAPEMSFAESIESFDDAKRVTIEGRPSGIVKTDQGLTFLTLADPDEGPGTIDVRLGAKAIEALAFANPSIAKTIRVTGVMSKKRTRPNSSATYELVTSSSEDVNLIERHPQAWRLIGGVLIGLASAAAFASLWSRMLKYQVERKTKVVTGVATQLRYSYDAIDDGVLVIDSDGVVLAVNDEFRRLAEMNVEFGSSIGDLPNHLQGRLKNPKEFRRQWEAWKLDHVSTSELEIELGGSEPLHVVVRSSPVRGVDQGGGKDHPMGRIMMWRDETERRQLHEELLHRNKLEAVGRLVAGVAHDFNNLLAAITGNLSVVRLKGNARVEEMDHELSVAEDAAFRGADVIRRLLTYSSGITFDLQPQGVNSIINRLSDLIRHTFDASITFEYDLDPRDPLIRAESTAIEQVILNLFVNARDAMPNGGTIRTSTRVVPGKDTGDMVLISVADTGVGVADEHVDRIFEPFFTTKDTEQGTGIGLSISFRVVREHHGKLRYRKRDQGGSEFQILLPLVTQDIEDSPALTSPTPSSTGTVLVVDDQDDVRFASMNVLRNLGYETLSASGGVEAIEVLAKDADSVDTVLLDVTMPGMSGHEVLEAIRKRWPALPVVLCSGYIVGETLSSGSNQTPDATIAKPYNANQLARVLSLVRRQNPGN